jgi:carbon monoxide dehydrogenase subunit G
VLKVNAEDRRLASATEANVTVRLEPTAPAAARLHVEAETTVRGKIAQFGQAMIKLAADDVLKRFAARLSQRLTAEQAARG